MTRIHSSMQLTRRADYAIRVLVHLAAERAGERMLLPELARATEVPESFLSKVLQALAGAGLISSRRGQNGGFAILPRGRTASMREAIEAIEGPFCLNVCLSSGLSCDRKTWCPVHPVWARAQKAMLSVLDGISIAELAADVRVAPALLSAETLRSAATRG